MSSGGGFDVTVMANVTTTHGAPVFIQLFLNSLLAAITEGRRSVYVYVYLYVYV